MKICLVSGMEISNPEAAPRSEYEGKTYYFCCKTCKAKFDKDPAKYIGRSDVSPSRRGHHCGCC